MKKILAMLLVLAMALSLVACGAKAPEAPAEAPAADVAMQYITADEAKALVESDEYVFFDVRKAADSSANSIPGAQAWDMDAAKEGDAEAGKATMKKATEGLDKKIIVVCYSGKRYAQATTNALSAIGYDMSKVYTLEGGFNNWSEKLPELTTAGVAPEAPAATEAPAAAAITNPDEIPDEMTSADGKYQIAFITDVGQLKDKSFNQGSFDGVKLYAANNGKSYKYYQPANGDQATDDDRIAAMKLACDNGAEVVVAAGFMQATALSAAAAEYPDVHFIFIDGWNMGLANIAAIAFEEHQSGYLAGYATVMEGYTELGFMGGGGGTNPACQRFGYGFFQGADAAAKELDVKVNMNYSWAYGASFSASPELQAMATGWYANGTEVIFACGGSMFQSISAAASAEDGMVVGVDVDQSFESPAVITSAMKGLADAGQWAIAKHYEGAWADVSDKTTSLGAKDNAVGLPTATWSLEGWSVADYEAMFAKMANGELEVSNELVLHPESTDNVTVKYVE